jgi:hypothetical protein
VTFPPLTAMSPAVVIEHLRLGKRHLIGHQFRLRVR